MNLLKIKKQVLKNTQPVWYNAIMKELDIKRFNIVNDKVDETEFLVNSDGGIVAL